MSVEVTCETGLGGGGGGALGLGLGLGRVGDVERLTEMGGAAWRIELGGAGGGGFRGGKGGDLVEGSWTLLILENGLWDG